MNKACSNLMLARVSKSFQLRGEGQSRICGADQKGSKIKSFFQTAIAWRSNDPIAGFLHCIWHFKFNSHKRHKPKMKAHDHWPLNSDYIKAQVPSKLLTRSLRRLRTGWLLVSAQLIIRSDYFKISNKVVTKRDSAEKACCILFSPNSHSFVARSWKGRSNEPGF